MSLYHLIKKENENSYWKGMFGRNENPPELFIKHLR